MRIYTAHTCPRRVPVLVREGFAWGALVFGPLWLFSRGAWVAGGCSLVAWLLLAMLLPAGLAGAVVLLLHWALGLIGNDLCRWSLAQSGYLLVHVVAAPDRDTAFARLMERRPDLIADALGGEVAA